MPDGTKIQIITLETSSGTTLEVLTLGGTIHRFVVPDKRGIRTDIVLGKETLQEYLKHGLCNSSIIGRFANRISNAAYVDGGKKVKLEKNYGAHCIHGASGCYALKVMSPNVFRKKNAIYLELQLLDDGQGGFPGHLIFSATYCLFDNVLQIEYKAVAAESTPWNPTSHAYFDLNGAGFGIKKDHELQIFADHYLPSTPDGVPTGEIRPVENTVFDFRNARNIRLSLEGQDSQLLQLGGFDHNFCINGSGMRKAAVLKGLDSGIKMEVWTDRPGLQLFTMNGVTTPVAGKNGHEYTTHGGICLETQHYPDAVNQPMFPNAMICGGRNERTVTEFVFR